MQPVVLKLCVKLLSQEGRPFLISLIWAVSELFIILSGSWVLFDQSLEALSQEKTD